MNDKLFQELCESMIEANLLAQEDLSQARKQFDSDSATFKLEWDNINRQLEISNELDRLIQESIRKQINDAPSSSG